MCFFFVELETGRCKPEKKAEGKEGVREPNPGDIVEPLCPGMFNQLQACFFLFFSYSSLSWISVTYSLSLQGTNITMLTQGWGSVVEDILSHYSGKALVIFKVKTLILCLLSSSGQYFLLLQTQWESKIVFEILIFTNLLIYTLNLLSIFSIFSVSLYERRKKSKLSLWFHDIRSLVEIFFGSVD